MALQITPEMTAVRIVDMLVEWRKSLDFIGKPPCIPLTASCSPCVYPFSAMIKADATGRGVMCIWLDRPDVKIALNVDLNEFDRARANGAIFHWLCAALRK